MIDYENIKLKQLTLFCAQLLEAKLNNYDYLKRRFLEQAPHFDETLEFLQYYNVVKVENKKIVFTQKMKNI